MNVNEDIFLLFESSTRRILPYSSTGLSRTQSGARKLLKNVGNLLVSRAGSAYFIASLSLGALVGSSFSEKAISFITSFRNLSISLQDTSISIEKFRELVVEYTKSDDDVWLQNHDSHSDLAIEIRACTEIKQVFNLLRIHSKEDCLDTF